MALFEQDKNLLKDIKKLYPDDWNCELENQVYALKLDMRDPQICAKYGYNCFTQTQIIFPYRKNIYNQVRKLIRNLNNNDLKKSLCIIGLYR
ncbi:MAG: hypothetical protein EOP34_03300 [Rickettsiales bacterium]|nr:MAG: hypothetical protein EOP34_03300 [Rickettsiales bacterium]